MCPFEVRKESNGKLLNLLKNGTYMQNVIINPERLGKYMRRDIAELLCMIGLKCINQNPL
jgi:hypothetical protein